MAISPTTQAALDRLQQYNGNNWDGTTNPYGMANGGHRQIAGSGLKQNFNQALTDLSTIANNADLIFQEGVFLSSTDSETIQTGSVTFTCTAEPRYSVNSVVTASADASNAMSGVVTGTSGNDITILIDQIKGSGTYASWLISPGQIGPNINIQEDGVLLGNAPNDLIDFQVQFDVTAGSGSAANVTLKPDYDIYQAPISVDPTYYFKAGPGDTLPPSLQVTRASSGTTVNQFGLVETVPAGGLRDAYNPVTLEYKGKLIEAQSRTNFCLHSEDFSNASWLQLGTSTVSSASSSPSGLNTASATSENTLFGSHRVRQTVVSNTGNPYTWSVWVKSNGRSRIVLREQSTFSAYGFDLSSGGSFVPSEFTTETPDSFFIEEYPDGWYRCGIGYTANATSFANIYLDNGTTTNYTGDGVSGVYLWGAQVEQGSTPSSYIPTTTSQVTRSGEVIRDTSVSEWLNQGQGNISVELGESIENIDTNSSIANISNASNQYFHLKTSGVNVQGLAFTPALNGITQVPRSGVDKISFSVGEDNYLLSANDQVSDPDTSGATPTGLTQLDIGKRYDGSQVSSTFYLKSFAYYPKRLTNAETERLVK